MTSSDPRTRTRAARAASGALAAGLLVLAAGCGGDLVTAGPATSSPVAATPAPSLPSSSSPGPTGAGAGDEAAPDAPASRATPATTPGGADGAAGGEAGGGEEDGGGEEAGAARGAGEDQDAGAAGPDAPEDAGTGPSEAAATGAGLSVVAVRTARHEGFDRVVLELAGDGGTEPGWFAHYVDEPSQQGSGDPLEVDGSSHLEVVVRGLGYPFDTGQDELTGTAAGAGTTLVREVLVGAVFEGQAQVVIGLDQEAPYSVTRLSDPPRVVVDVAT